MVISSEIKLKIENEYKKFEEIQYGGNDKSKRKELGQFYTPPQLTIQMLEKFDDLNGTILDPTCGAGGLLAAAIIAGADPKKCYGIELDKNILQNITIPRLKSLGVPEKNLHQGNALNDDCYDFSDGYEYDENSNTVSFNKRRKLIFGGAKISKK